MSRVAPVPGFPGYTVSDEGEVFTSRRWGRVIRRAPYRMKGGLTDGYRMVVLVRDDGSHNSRTVHRLVLETFVGPRPLDMQARHLNGNRLDNRLDNLVWGTLAENMEDLMRHGTRARGPRHPRARLNADIVRVIRAQASRPAGDLAQVFGVSKGAIDGVRYGITWRHVQP